MVKEKRKDERKEVTEVGLDFAKVTFPEGELEESVGNQTKGCRNTLVIGRRRK